MANFANMEAYATLGRKQAQDPSADTVEVPRSGFNFDLVRRNQVLQSTGLSMPKPMSTGTTICGVVFENGIVLGADTRATAGNVADKNCEKIHYIAPNIYCCGAGTAADTEMTTALIASQNRAPADTSRMSKRLIRWWTATATSWASDASARGLRSGARPRCSARARRAC